MANFEEEITNKTKEQLESVKLDEKTEIESTKVDETQFNLNQEENNDSSNNFTDNSSVVQETKHFERKEKVRPLAVVVGVLSLLATIGIIAVSVFALIKLVPPLWQAVLNVSNTFFNEKVLAFSLGLGWVLGGVVVFLIALLVIGFALVLGSLSFTAIGIPIVAFKTSKLPKQVFAHEKSSFGNMIFSYIVSLLILILGVLLFIDGSYGYISFIVLGGGIVFLAVAVIITIDIVQCKKAYNNLEDETEKQEILNEANNIANKKKSRQKHRKLIGKILSKLFSKK